MFLTDISEEELEFISNYSLSESEEDLEKHAIFDVFKCKLISEAGKLASGSSSINFSQIEPEFIKKIIHQFNYYYWNSTDDNLLSLKASSKDSSHDYSEAPCIYYIECYINSITNASEKTLTLYGLGLIYVWDMQNSFSFIGADINFCHTWYQYFFASSIKYFDLWKLVYADFSVEKSISERSSKAAKSKHQSNYETKAYAIQAFTKTSCKSVKQAAFKIAPSVINYGKNIGFVFSSDHQAIDTIYKWLLQHKKTL